MPIWRAANERKNERTNVGQPSSSPRPQQRVNRAHSRKRRNCWRFAQLARLSRRRRTLRGHHRRRGGDRTEPRKKPVHSGGTRRARCLAPAGTPWNAGRIAAESRRTRTLNTRAHKKTRVGAATPAAAGIRVAILSTFAYLGTCFWSEGSSFRCYAAFAYWNVETSA